MVDIFEAEMFAGKMNIEFFNGAALKHLVHVNLIGLMDNLTLGQSIAEAAG